ncbi:MAG: GGDEF domain-containing protein [Algicola sp.]|nr:GGDEF domain-containing protein [Algicola sp.]
MSKIIQSFQRSIILTFFCGIIVVVLVSYYTISGVVNEQGKRQQESIIPFFSLISQQILKPLYISQTMANDQLLLDLVEEPDVSVEKLIQYLALIEQKLGFMTFIALENQRYQVHSNGRHFPLLEKDVQWYFAIKDQPAEQFAMIGKDGDPHLYVDLRLRNKQGEFVGFIGIGIRLTDFVDLFEQYKQHFGYDFVFANEKGAVMLSSDQNLMSRSDSLEVTNVSDYPWYKVYQQQIATGENVIGSAVVNVDNEDVLISNMRLAEFDWDLYVLSPLTTHQSEIRYLFIRNVILLLLVLVILVGIITVVLHYFDNALIKNSETDHLTGLPNRFYAQWSFDEMTKNYQSIAVILSDIDLFKKVNDQYGHDFGDQVIKLVSAKLNTDLRDQDVVARWGGEEFVILLPGAPLVKAQLIANRIRESIAEHVMEHDGQTVHVTTSLGLTVSKGKQALTELVNEADQALYVAKNNGRNRVEIYKPTEVEKSA